MKSRLVFVLGSFSFFIYIILAFLFYKERTIMPDMAFQFFCIIKNKDFAIQIHRYGAVLTQLFPFLGMKLGLSLNTLSQLYSLSFPIVYLLEFVLIAFALKNERIAVVFFLFHFLINTHSFFWCQCELIQGVSFTLLYIAWIERHLTQPFKWNLFWGISLIGLVTIVFFYPLLIIVLVYALLFLYLNSDKKENKRLYLHVFLVYFLLFIFKLIFVRNFYDAGALNNLKNFYTLFPSYFSTPSWGNFYTYLIKDYWGLILLFCLVVYKYFHTKKWLNLALFLSFFIGIIFLINICYKDGAEQFYLEGQYSILCVFLGFSLAYDIVSDWSLKWMFGFISMILFLFIYRITSTRSVYSDRVNLYRNLITEFLEKKVILENQPHFHKILKMEWGSSFEIWLLSTTERGKTSSIIIKDNPKDLDWALDKSKSFITEWEIVDYDKLNPNYFIFKDSGTYTKIQQKNSSIFR